MLHYSGLAFYGETQEGIITSWSKGAEKIFGQKTEDITGKNISVLYSPDLLEEISAAKSKISRGSDNEIITAKFFNENTAHTLRFSIFPVRNNSQAIEGFITRAEEFAGTNQNQEIESDLQKSLKEISDYKYALDVSSIVAITDQRGIIKHVNDNFCRISKYTAEELIGKDHRIINSGYHSKEYIRNLWTTIANGRIWKGELRNKAKDGSYYWVDTTIVPFLNELGKPYQYVAIRSDITSRKKAESEITELNEKLEARVLERTAELNTLNEELESFSYTISHDLRAPLRAINGFSYILKQSIEDKLSENDKANFEKIINNTIRMGRLIDDLLAFSRLGRTDLLKSPFSMRNLVDDVAKEFLSENENKNIQFINSVSHTTASDLNLMRQVWTNLISNAIKYSSIREEIIIETGSEENDDSYTFYIKDNGAGFDMKYADKLFGVFQRLHADRQFEGIGVGLAFVKKIIYKHHGKVWAESRLDEGAKFYFTLPK
jgi:PAS domain S-box-containing protein